MAADPWRELGIAPTLDRGDIRRAYAARLKAIDADRDPAAFRRLRAAYEAAIAFAASGGTRIAETDDMREPSRRTPNGADASGPIPERLALGDVAGAFALLQQADARHELPLWAVHDLEEQMLAAAAPLRALPPDTLLAMVRRFGWDEAAHPLRAARPSLFLELDRRLDAERWYAELVERAAGRRRKWPDTGRFVARLMLRGRPRWYEWFGLAVLRLALGTPRLALTDALRQFGEHEEWSGDRFDARRIRWCRSHTKPTPLLFIYIMGIGSIVPIVAYIQDRDALASLAVVGVNFVAFAIAWMVIRLAARFGARRHGR